MTNPHRLLRSVIAGVLAVLTLLSPAYAQVARQPDAPAHTRPPLTNPACASGLRVVGTGAAAGTWVDCFIIGNDGRMLSHLLRPGLQRRSPRLLRPGSRSRTPPPDGLDLGARSEPSPAWGVGRLYLGCGRGGALTFDWYGWDSVGRPKD
jgi:hypothetical protein